MNILIIDTGINSKHPAFNGYNILTTGYSNQCSLSDVTDCYGHGTAIADLIIRNHNPNDINIYILKLFNESLECNLDDLIEALVFVKNNNIYNIINMSLGVSSFEESFQIMKMKELCNDISSKGTILVSAFDNFGTVSYPSAFDSVIGVDMSIKVRNRSEIELYYNSMVNIKGFGANQKVAWVEPEYMIARGSSYACANITNIIISICKAKLNIFEGLKRYAIKECEFEIAKPIPTKPDWLEGAKAIIVPFNKENHSLLAYENLLIFTICGIYDFKYFGKIGQDVSKYITYRDVGSKKIENYEMIDWESYEFDTVIAGHLGEISWRCKKDVLEEVIKYCCIHNKNLYAFDDIKRYEDIIIAYGGKKENFFSPEINSQHITKKKFGKLYEIMSPVLAVVGTSAKQGKFTLQLGVREKLKNIGYKIGQIGSEPSALCYGIDYVFPNGYESTVLLHEKESILILNEMLHKLDMKGIDLSLVGTQAETIPYSNYNLDSIPLEQVEFLLGTNPDAFILCVNIHDDIDYIIRTLHGVESYFNCKCLAIVIYPFSYSMMIGGIFKRINSLHTDEYKSFYDILKSKINITILSLEDALKGDILIDNILNYFSSNGQ